MGYNDFMILASASPRRRELLKKITDDFKIEVPSVEEISEGLPEEIALENALKKARAVASLYPEETVIGADTVVAVKGKILGKPRDINENIEFLKELSSSFHSVFTGYAVIKDGKEYCGVEKTDVYFNGLTQEQILSYAKSGEGLDKAGGYAIQKGGFVKKIVGSYDNVVGFPTREIEQILKELKVIV